jgi:hypothetical protein
MRAGASRWLVVALSGLTLAAALALPATAAAATRPVVTSVRPAKGPALGGTVVTVRGRNFTSGRKSVVKAVRFGSQAATKVRVLSATRLTCRAPLGVGTVNVRVITKAGMSARTPANRYVYLGGRPVITSINPNTGSTAGGTVVTLAGRNFTGTTAVWFGGLAAHSFKVSSGGTVVTATTPAQSGAGDPYDVTVTTPLGTSARVRADQFSYYAPAVVSSVSPINGPTPGGNLVTITGQHLWAGRYVTDAVKFGGVAVPDSRVTFKSDSTIVATAPAGAGTVDVTVTTPAGPSATSPNDKYSYAAQMTPQSATTQSAVAGATVGTPPSVIVKDGNGQPVEGVTVVFAVTSGGGSVTGGTAATNASGIATLDSWTLGSTAGTNTLTASSAGLTDVTFSATGVAGAAFGISANSVQNQSATAGGGVSAPPSVIVKDAKGNPVAGVTITFTVTSGNGSVNGDSTTTGIMTDASGVATVGSWTLGSKVGANTLTASGSGLAGSPVTFSATGTVGAPTQIAPNSVTDQSATAGGPAGTLPSVIVEDANGNPVSGVSVTFTVISGSGSVSGTPVSTGSSGIATVGSWTLGPSAGTNTLTATATDVSGSVTFSAIGTITVTAVDSITDISVANGTPLGSVSLPATVGVSLSNGGSATADVTWDGGTPAYDGNTAGAYNFVGTLSGLPTGVTNPLDLTAAVTVNVQP